MNAGAAVVSYRASDGRIANVMTLRGSMPSDSPRRRASVASMRLPPIEQDERERHFDGDGEAAQRKPSPKAGSRCRTALSKRGREARSGGGQRWRESAEQGGEHRDADGDREEHRIDARAHELTDAAIEVRWRDRPGRRDDDTA